MNAIHLQACARRRLRLLWSADWACVSYTHGQKLVGLLVAINLLAIDSSLVMLSTLARGILLMA